ncbi:DUF4148 domain-containing protein [Burkholderia thailandensis]|uniref:DUF4148 domain-containing protein n=1 Tax=Burkholderia thailandensis (strain ATCC 700388 / DSM 13276 / CCUG 48851 / CIP 106301 / E264) TaxID=271848 RepID=Q2T615_BURTA|nr:DUF4148 domain-containing protein [Burkholderia thailandensis]ABC35357.1 conserved hypothetical protein [Burkholderia thailandensis E264]AHI75897.1 hypothetical protein BTQ_4471 [Burkholderia thailandensis 2002721723]AHI81674.1 hypothetical protein BTJ_5452 [Burkholderia thailandensis E444]AIC89244.1 hypothetical protein BTRA_4446 [Burkholderia thailandensis USAMRU Malaysia \
MKSLIATLVVASSVMLPSLSFAEQPPGLTRAQVRAQLVCAEQQGMIPQAKQNYPFSAKQTGAACDTSGSGAAMTGSAQAGAPAWQPSDRTTLFRHH